MSERVGIDLRQCSHLNGYELGPILGLFPPEPDGGPAPAASDPASTTSSHIRELPCTFATSKDGTQLRAKCIPLPATCSLRSNPPAQDRLCQLLRNIRHASISPVLHVGFADVHSVSNGLVTCVVIITPLYPDTAVSVNLKDAVRDVLGGVKVLQAVLGSTANLNIKRSNLMCGDGCVVLGDWFVGCLGDEVGGSDAKNLAEYLVSSVGGAEETHFRNFVRELESLNCIDPRRLEQHSWLCKTANLSRPVAMHPVMLSRTSAKSKRMTPAQFISGGHGATRDMLQFFLLRRVANLCDSDRDITDAFLKSIYDVAVQHTPHDEIITDALIDDLVDASQQTYREMCNTRKHFEPRKIESCWAFEAGIDHTAHSQEDVFVTIPDLAVFMTGTHDPTRTPTYCVSLFDGHLGAEAADYCSHQLLPAMFRYGWYEGDEASFAVCATEVFSQINKRFLARAKETGTWAGTTATIAVIQDTTLLLANVGDSSALLCGDGGLSYKVITEDHRASNPSEEERVVRSGGCLLPRAGRSLVDGMLEVTRSIGDVRMEGGVVSCVPYTHSCSVVGYDFLVVASDGVWDVLQPSEVVAALYAVRAELYQGESEECAALVSGEPIFKFSEGSAAGQDDASESHQTDDSAMSNEFQIMAEAVVSEARDRGSVDDIAVVVSLLPSAGDRERG